VSRGRQEPRPRAHNKSGKITTENIKHTPKRPQKSLIISVFQQPQERKQDIWCSAAKIKKTRQQQQQQVVKNRFLSV
jgi:hypothetical protein